jgi:membrane protein YqaA with SNARE-associated domain
VSDSPINVRQLLRSFFLGVIGIMLLSAVLGKLFKTELVSLGQGFVETFGGPGLAACLAVPDAVPFPPVHEFCTGFALLGGMPFWTVVAWGSAGSIGGGTLGFLIGRVLVKTERFQRFVAGRGQDAWEGVRQYGAAALALGALSPLPFSICCWASGALRLRPTLFFVVALLRIPRVAFYLWLIKIGLKDIS